MKQKSGGLGEVGSSLLQNIDAPAASYHFFSEWGPGAEM